MTDVRSPFFAPCSVEARYGSTKIGPIALWMHDRDAQTFALKPQSPVPLLVTRSDAEWEAADSTIIATGLIDVEVDVPSDFELPDKHHLVIEVGHRRTSVAKGTIIRRSSCIVLTPCIDRDRRIWRTHMPDAASFLNEKWRSADVWATLLVGKASRKNIQDVKLVVSNDSSPVQWRLSLSHAYEWRAETFMGVALDLLREVVPKQTTEGFEAKHQLNAALDAGLDLHEVLHAHRVAFAADPFVRTMRSFLQGKRTHAPIQTSIRGIDPRRASAYWAENGFSRPIHVLRSHLVGGRVLPTTFVTVRHQAADPDMRVAAAAALRVLAHVSRSLHALDSFTGHGLDQATRAYIDAPRANLVGKKVGLEAALRDTKLRSDAGAVDVPLEHLQAVSPKASELRRRAIAFDRGLSREERSIAPLFTEATNKVYEAWCFLRVALALQRLGFRKNRFGDAWSPEELYYPLHGEFQLSHPTRLTGAFVLRKEPEYVTYGRRLKADYFGVESRYEEGLTNVRAGGATPDIVLEFTGGPRPDHVPAGCPQLVTLDATSSDRKDMWQDKYKYYDVIRAFEGCTTRDSAGNVQGRPIERDVSTGESPRIVRAAWAVCPGARMSVNDPDPEGPYFEMPAAPDERRLRHGHFVLTARAAPDYEPLTEWLDNLLTGLALIRPA